MTGSALGEPDLTLVDRARGGDEEAFRVLVVPHRRGLELLCYRMLGSPYEAEDLVQETLLRAWRRLDSFQGRGSFRAWLYRIATNACLDVLDVRTRRILPQAYGPPTNHAPGGPPALDVAWLGPYPDALLDEIADPAAAADVRYEERQSVQLAFIAAIQYLPPRQRAALLLRDALGWRAQDVAEVLETSVAAVQSSLQRARARLRRTFPTGRPETLPEPDDGQRALLERYVRAWEQGDLAAFIALLREDAILTMPPMLEWYRGRGAIESFFRWAWGPEGLGPFRLLPTGANRQPAFGLYGRDPTGPGYQALAIQVLALDGTAIHSLTGFVDSQLFMRFALPSSLAG